MTHIDHDPSSLVDSLALTIARQQRTLDKLADEAHAIRADHLLDAGEYLRARVDDGDVPAELVEFARAEIHAACSALERVELIARGS